MTNEILPEPIGAMPPPINRRQFARRAAIAGASALGIGAGQSRARGPARPDGPIRVRIWCEGAALRSVYPKDIDGALGDDLRRRPGLSVSSGRLREADAGLSDSALDATEVLIWWGRLRHDDLPESRSRAVVDRVLAGRLGLVALNASCGSKPFRALMKGAACEPSGWRVDGRPERVEVRDPTHPIARGIGSFTIPRASMFAEPFAVPDPDSVVFVSNWGPGETFRSGLTWTLGQGGRVVYFRPGHDAFPVLFHPSVRQVIANSTAWAAGRI